MQDKIKRAKEDLRDAQEVRNRIRREVNGGSGRGFFEQKISWSKTYSREAIINFWKNKFSVKFFFNKIAMEGCVSFEHKTMHVIFVLLQIMEVYKW